MTEEEQVAQDVLIRIATKLTVEIHNRELLLNPPFESVAFYSTGGVRVKILRDLNGARTDHVELGEHHLLFRVTGTYYNIREDATIMNLERC